MSQDILFKLQDFIKKYYYNQLLKGLLFFAGLGLLYFLINAFIEYFLWLPMAVRTLMFWGFVVVLFLLFSYYILRPLLKLFNIQKGISPLESSKIIGNHFPEVADQLTNYLQLAQNKEQSELLKAAMAQKEKNLAFVPFVQAIPFKKNVKYVPLLIIPILIIGLLFLTQNDKILTDGFSRIINYQAHYEPPAPYRLEILNKDLITEQGKDFVLSVRSVGKIVPENIKIEFDNESYFLDSSEPGLFNFTFNRVSKNIRFALITSVLRSSNYELTISEVPTISNLSMQLNYPKYLNKASETIRGNGNAIVPEGTVVQWKINSQNTQHIELLVNNQSDSFLQNGNEFLLNKKIKETIEYQIITSNETWKNYENLAFKIDVVKDLYPQIQVFSTPDSLNLDKQFLVGQISDDHGLSKLQIVYYPNNNPTDINTAKIAIKNNLSDRFVFAFPANLKVEEGVTYSYYFEVFDNDAINNFKSTKSNLFSNRILTSDEAQKELLKQKQENISQLSKAVKEQNQNMNELEKLQNLQKQKPELDFKDRKKIQDFIDKQKRQEDMMKQFSEKLKENLKSEPNKNEDKKELERRLDNLDKETDKQQKLLDELQKLSDMLQEEKLFDKLDEMKQKSKNQMKNLEQLVELTKKYYVEKKLDQLGNALDKLAEKQDKLAESDKNNAKEQDNIQEEFKNIQKELRELEKENKSLKRPLDLPTDKNEEQEINDNMQNAKEDLNKDNKPQAAPKQKNAAQKMQQMGMKMKGSAGQNQQQQMQEDIKTLRQILDNLLAFSFSQEGLIDQFKSAKKSDPNYAEGLKKQQKLKQLFKHVDDSLYVVSMRNKQITEMMVEEAGKIHYNLDKSLERLAEMDLNRGLVNQQYTLTSANKLADFLSNVMNNMQMQMSGSGGGEGMPSPGGNGGEKQLKDIIKKQGELGEKMQEGMQKGQEKGKGEEPGKEGKDGKQGSGQGKDGEGKGQDGNGSQNNGDGEQNAKELMEIYKEQRKLRQQLEDALRKEGLTPDGKKVLDQMKDAEKQLLNKGFRNENLQKILNIKYEMLKLEKALQQQGEDNKRESETNQTNFDGSQKPLPESLQKYLKSVENLNRQALPLQPVYKKKVDQYFN